MSEQNQPIQPEKGQSSTAIVVVIVVLVVIGVVVYFATRNNDSTGTTNTNATLNSSENTPAANNVSVNTPASNAPVNNAPANQGAVKEFTVKGNNFAFDLKEIKVKKGDTVKINFQNTAGTHDFVLDEFANAKTAILESGKSQTIEFVADKTGTFEYYCSVGTHRQMGMKGNLIVE